MKRRVKYLDLTFEENSGYWAHRQHLKMYYMKRKLYENNMISRSSIAFTLGNYFNVNHTRLEQFFLEWKVKHKSAQNQNVTLHRIEDAEHQWKLPYKRELFAKLHDITFATKPQQTTNKSSRILKILPAESNSAKNETRKESCFITLGRGKKRKQHDCTRNDNGRMRKYATRGRCYQENFTRNFENSRRDELLIFFFSNQQNILTFCCFQFKFDTAFNFLLAKISKKLILLRFVISFMIHVCSFFVKSHLSVLETVVLLFASIAHFKS